MTPRNQHKAYVTSYSARPRPEGAGALLVLGGLDLLMALWCNAGMNKLPRAKRIQVLNMLVEGSSMRSRVLRSPALLASSARIGASGARGSIQNPPHRGHAAKTMGATVCGGIPQVGVSGWKGLCGPLTGGGGRPAPGPLGVASGGTGDPRPTWAVSKLP